MSDLVALAGAQSNGARAVVGPPDLARPVKDLAKGMENLMVALHALQKAIHRASPCSPGIAQVLADIEKNRGALSAEWSLVLDFLRDCYNYCTERKDLCETIKKGAAYSDAISAFDHIPAMSRKMLDGTKEIGRWPETVRRRSDDALLVLAYVPRDKANRQNAIPLHDVHSALNMIDTALKDLRIFWEGEVNAGNLPMIPEIAGDMWDSFPSVLHNAMASISKTSDALTIDLTEHSQIPSPRESRSSEGADPPNTFVGWLRRALRRRLFGNNVM